MSLMAEGIETQLRRLGFADSEFGMATRIGTVEIHAVEHPLKGVSLTFTRLDARNSSQSESFFPKTFSSEQIAAFIYANFRLNFKSRVDECKGHFEALGIPIKAE
jgi:hypothetical protein